MNQEILDFYLKFSQYTDPWLYKDYLKELPSDIKELSYLIRKTFIHRTTLADGNVWSNADLRFGDMTKVPWYRQPEDDNFPTVGGILTDRKSVV